MIVIESLNYVNIPAEDIEKSLEFYTMFLDFEKIKEGEKEAIISFDDKLMVRLYKARSGDRFDFPILSFVLDIDDFTEALQDIETEGVTIASGPSETPNGEHVLIKDPAGNILELYYEE